MNQRECKIQHYLFRWLCYDRRHKWIVPNVRGVFSTGECDVFSMTARDIGYEFEIKTSRSDFKADAKKGVQDTVIGADTCGKFQQLDLRRQGQTTYNRRWGIGLRYIRNDIPLITPHHFSYVVPTDMVQLDEVPEYAGLYYIDIESSNYYGGAITEIRKPIRLHSDPLPETLKPKLAEKLMYRFWNERERVLNAIEKT